MASFMQFFSMGGYGWYVWGAYGSVAVFLIGFWFVSWRRFKNYLREQKIRHE